MEIVNGFVFESDKTFGQKFNPSSFRHSVAIGRKQKLGVFRALGVRLRGLALIRALEALRARKR